MKKIRGWGQFFILNVLVRRGPALGEMDRWFGQNLSPATHHASFLTHACSYSGLSWFLAALHSRCKWRHLCSFEFELYQLQEVFFTFLIFYSGQQHSVTTGGSLLRYQTINATNIDCCAVTTSLDNERPFFYFYTLVLFSCFFFILFTPSVAVELAFTCSLGSDRTAC